MGFCFIFAASYLIPNDSLFTCTVTEALLTCIWKQQIIENMKAIDVIPMLTPDILEKIEAIIQTKPKRGESYR